MSKGPNLSAVAGAGQSGRMQQSPKVSEPLRPNSQGKKRGITASRVGAKPITAFYPEEVRIQLKTLAAEQGRSMESMIGEALDHLFAKYGKPAIARGGR
jgi:Arc-like DNA binding domain